MLLRLIEAKTPLMFHCAAGKDRTGVAAALLLSLLGVGYEQIIDDYLLTQQVVDQLMGAWNAGGATGAEDYQDFQGNLARQPRELIQPVFDADPAYIETLLDYVDATYGSFINYALDQLAMSEQQLENLRGNLLEPQS
jgi:protein-tyrosine phosphatase